MLLPAKFHRKIWIRKGSYVIVELLADGENAGESVRGQIARVLMQDDVKYLKSMDGVWPERFAESSDREEVEKDMDSLCLEKGVRELSLKGEGDASESCGSSRCSSDEDGLPPIERIQNRRSKNIHYAVSDSDSE
jgi:probable RNA-binding protein EIF1AD